MECLLPCRIFAFGYTTSDGKRKLLSAPFLPLKEVLFYGVLPMLIQRCAAPDDGHSLAHHLVVEAGALTVAVVVHRPVGGNAQAARRLHRVDVGPQEKELPAIFLLLPLNYLLDSRRRVAAAGIFYTAGGDDEEGMLRHVLKPGALVDVPNVVDGPADGVQQGGTAPYYSTPFP